MSTRSPENPLWLAHIERLHRLTGGLPPVPTQLRTQRVAIGAAEAEAAWSSEWSAAPPGRLGRRLLANVESYLEFFAIARS